jgi:hypothetical protein
MKTSLGRTLKDLLAPVPVVTKITSNPNRFLIERAHRLDRLERVTIRTVDNTAAWRARHRAVTYYPSPARVIISGGFDNA